LLAGSQNMFDSHFLPLFFFLLLLLLLLILTDHAG
jgi:hypothetical protein